MRSSTRSAVANDYERPQRTSPRNLASRTAAPKLRWRQARAPLDPVRRRLLRLMSDGHTNLRAASLAVERNPTYLRHFIHRDTTREGRDSYVLEYEYR